MKDSNIRYDSEAKKHLNDIDERDRELRCFLAELFALNVGNNVVTKADIERARICLYIESKRQYIEQLFNAKGSSTQLEQVEIRQTVRQVRRFNFRLKHLIMQLGIILCSNAIAGYFNLATVTPSWVIALIVFGSAGFLMMAWTYLT